MLLKKGQPEMHETDRPLTPKEAVIDQMICRHDEYDAAALDAMNDTDLAQVCLDASHEVHAGHGTQFIEDAAAAAYQWWKSAFAQRRQRLGLEG